MAAQMQTIVEKKRYGHDETTDVTSEQLLILSQDCLAGTTIRTPVGDGPLANAAKQLAEKLGRAGRRDTQDTQQAIGGTATRSVYKLVQHVARSLSHAETAGDLQGDFSQEIDERSGLLKHALGSTVAQVASSTDVAKSPITIQWRSRQRRLHIVCSGP